MKALPYLLIPFLGIITFVIVFFYGNNYSPLDNHIESMIQRHNDSIRYTKEIREEIGHNCKWTLCPYKGVIPFDYKEAIIEYTDCAEGTDCYMIDLLHLQHPTEEYDQLEERFYQYQQTNKL